MNHQAQTLEEISAILIQLRSDPRSRRNFPKELWNSIIQLTQVHSVKDVCRHLNLNPVYLKEKMRLLNACQPQQLDFQEVLPSIHGVHSNMVTIELFSNSGLKAKIQAPASCLHFLVSLFKG